MAFDELDRQDAEAVLRARQELGPAYDSDLVNSFAERIENAVEQRVQQQNSLARRRSRGFASGGVRQTILSFVSLGLAIPITAVAGGTAGVEGVMVAWIGIVGVNVAHSLANRPGRF